MAVAKKPKIVSHNHKILQENSCFEFLTIFIFVNSVDLIINHKICMDILKIIVTCCLILFYYY